ncbi:hypothetical protein MTO96_026843 [Rhipicephalus appendiculatus]
MYHTAKSDSAFRTTSICCPHWHGESLHDENVGNSQKEMFEEHDEYLESRDTECSTNSWDAATAGSTLESSEMTEPPWQASEISCSTSSKSWSPVRKRRRTTCEVTAPLGPANSSYNFRQRKLSHSPPVRRRMSREGQEHPRSSLLQTVGPVDQPQDSQGSLSGSTTPDDLDLPEGQALSPVEALEHPSPSHGQQGSAYRSHKREVQNKGGKSRQSHRQSAECRSPISFTHFRQGIRIMFHALQCLLLGRVLRRLGFLVDVK